MCNCGRKSTEVVTSAQVAQDEAMRQAQDPEYQAAVAQASASNALANANTGWFLAEPAPQA